MESGRRDKIIVILGPTASGKSDVAIRLAKKFNGEIISADSRQVYKGMDIGTGKVEGFFEIKKGAYISEDIPHYAIDITDPNEDFNVSNFKKYAGEKIENILRRGKLPIICGGTGFWIKTIVDGASFPEVKPNPDLRKKLEKETVDSLFNKLKKIDPKRAETIDSKNKVRLIRALEICARLGSVPEIKKEASSYDFLQIGIDITKEKLQRNIKIRLEKRFETGMVKEVQDLHENGVTWKRLESFGLEYRDIAQYLQEKIDLEEMKEELYYDIIHYAKRQITWFKKDKRIAWLESYNKIEKKTEDFLLF